MNLPPVQPTARHAVVIVGDEESVRIALRLTVNSFERFECAHSFGTAHEFLSAAPRIDARIVLLDLCMPGTSGFDCLGQIRDLHPKFRVVIVSAIEEPETIDRCARLGCSSYIPKPFSRKQVLASLVQAAATLDSVGIDRSCARLSSQPRDCPRFSATEHAILRLIAKGHTYKQAADTLGKSESTVRNILHGLFTRLGVVNGTVAVLDWRDCRRCFH